MTEPKQPLWLPKAVQDTNVSKFMSFVNKQTGLRLRHYDDLYQWSVNPLTIGMFWEYAYMFLELNPQQGSPKSMTRGLMGDHNLFPRPEFFPSQKLNLAEIILRNGLDETIAIHFAREGSAIEEVTWSSLRQRTGSARSALVNSGIKTGDKVAAVISNSVDAVVLCLATLSIGAIWSSASCDLGAKAIVDRFIQVKPKIIFADNGYRYGGKTAFILDHIARWAGELAKSSDELQNVVVISCLQPMAPMPNITKGVLWSEFIKRDSGDTLSFQSLPFDHPAFILFSSGTTGSPKCIVHSAGGVALKVKVDSQLQHDMRPGDVIFQYTTTAWVMWVLNFVNISSGVSMLLYDGSPFHPEPDVLLKLIEKIGVTVFGTSPRYMAELRTRNIIPKLSADLGKLRVVTSTGAALSPEMYTWFYETGFPRHTHLISMSGGTDLCGSLVGGTPLLPVYAGEIQAKCLGMAIDIFDAVKADPFSIECEGEAGELVCTKPFPSQPLTFYGKRGDEKYRSSYFARFGTRVWCQGDFAQIDKVTKGIKMLGRSDGVLNPSGVRFGSAEIYAVLDKFSEVEDSLCVGQRRESDEDEAVLLFILMKPKNHISSDLIGRIKKAIQERYSPRHVPKAVFEVDAIPYTVNGKKCEINVKRILNGMDSSVGGTVANPESLGGYEKYHKLPKHVVVGKTRSPKL